ncbi:putative DNA polymerase epsilon subunit 2-like [Capsicum annuum]|nr:putative DNA polymerase epsilon subunit 2-like [Capsicum annuum]
MEMRSSRKVPVPLVTSNSDKYKLLSPEAYDKIVCSKLPDCTHQDFCGLDFFGRPICSSPNAWFDVVDRLPNDNNKSFRSIIHNKDFRVSLGMKVMTYCHHRLFHLHLLSMQYQDQMVLGDLLFRGGTSIHMELEQCVANFVRKPTTIAIGMGYVTNLARLPVLIEKGVLIINNSLNRNSIINGARESGATFCVFQHNTAFALHMALRSKIDLITMDTPDWTYKVQIVDINKLVLLNTYLISAAWVKDSPKLYARPIHTYYWVVERINPNDENEKPLTPPTKLNLMPLANVAQLTPTPYAEISILLLPNVVRLKFIYLHRLMLNISPYFLLIDVLGVVIRCSPEKYAGRTQNGRREITIADDQNTQFLLTLWVEFSEIEGFELQAKVEKEEYPVILGRNIGISSY